METTEIVVQDIRYIFRNSAVYPPYICMILSLHQSALLPEIKFVLCSINMLTAIAVG
jgi:hypothetical protein